MLGLCWWLRAFSSCSKPGLLLSSGLWASHCGGFSCRGPWTLGRAGFSTCVSRGLNCSSARVFRLDQRWNPCALPWRVKSQPQDCQESPILVSVQFSSAAHSYPTLCDPVDRSTPGLPVHQQLPEFTQTHDVHSCLDVLFSFFFSFIFISWKLITLQYCSGVQFFKSPLTGLSRLEAWWSHWW